MRCIGITGQTGFIGSHLVQALRLAADLEPVTLPRFAWDQADRLADFARRCEVIVHLAGLSRLDDGDRLFHTNLTLGEKLLAAIRQAGTRPLLLLGSTTHEQRPGRYHESKRELRRLFEAELPELGGQAVTLLMPNTFGPFAKPFFNSVVSTFCYQAATGQKPEIVQDAELELIFVGDLCRQLVRFLHRKEAAGSSLTFGETTRLTVSELLRKITGLQENLNCGRKPELDSDFDAKLYLTLQSYQQ